MTYHKTIKKWMILKMKCQTIPLGNFEKVSNDTYILRTDFVDSYDDCIDLFFTIKKDEIVISDDGTFNDFYQIDDKNQKRIQYLQGQSSVLKDKSSGCFYKKVSKNKSDLIVSFTVTMIQFLIQVNTIAISM